MITKSRKFNKPAGKVSHSWWEDLIKIGGDSVVKWFDNEGKKIEAEGKVAEANAQNNMSTLLAQLKSKESENSTKTAYVIGGSIVAVVLVIVVAMMFKK